MSEANPHSARFKRAATAESERLLKRQGRVNRQVSELETKLDKAKAELAEVVNRLEALRSIAGDAGAPKPIGVALPSGVPLSGSAIRREAVRLLLGTERADQAIHYRDWLALMEDAGYSVEGKRPEAVFLGQIVRSPVVRATTNSGYYVLDREAPNRLRERIATLEQDVGPAPEGRLAVASQVDNQMARDRERSAELRRLQRSLREALEVLGSSMMAADQRFAA